MDDERRERVERAVALVLAAGVRLGCRESRCHDCAYRTDSPEMADYYEAGYGTQVFTLREDLEFLFRGELDRPSLFVCHQGMPTGPGGPPDYRPPRDADGNPEGFPLCAGWLAEFDRQLRAHNEARERSP